MSASIIIGYREVGDTDRDRAYRLVHDHMSEVAPVIVIDPPGELYSRALAFNIGISQARTSVVVCANSDVIVNQKRLHQAVQLAAETGTTVYPFTRYRELTRECTRRYLDGDHACDDATLIMRDSVGPIFCVRRDRYHDAGGCDPRFVGWGFEDVAWAIVSDQLLGPHQRVPGEAVHLWHPPDPYSAAADMTGEVYQQNQRLCWRYEEARNDPVGLRRLQAEH